MYGTRKKFLNTEIEPHIEALNEINVDKVTILEPCDSEIVSRNINSDNIYCRLVHIMKQSTQEYYNIRMVLRLESK